MIIFVIPIGAILIAVICVVKEVLETRERNKILRQWGYKRKKEDRDDNNDV